MYVDLFRTESLRHFFLRWTPEHHSNFGSDDVERSPMIEPSSSKDGEEHLGQGFVLLANNDPELTGDPPSTTTDNNSSKPHYLKRQNTLLKDWEVR